MVVKYMRRRGVPPIGLKGKVLAVLTLTMRGWVCTIFAFHFDLLVSFHIAKLKARNFLG